MVNVTSLSENCVLVAVHARYWRGSKKSPQAADTIRKEYFCAEDFGQAIKRCLDADSVSGVLGVLTAAKARLEKDSLPWLEGGYRIVPTTLYMGLAADLRVLRGQYEQAIEDFIRNYAQTQARARERLQGLFDPADYPPIEQVRRKFGLDVETLPVAVDWRVNLSDSSIQDLRNQTETLVAERLESATVSLIERLRDVISRAAEKLDGGGVFRDSLLGNIRDVVAVLPKLNIAADPRIDGLIKSLERSVLTTADPDDFRHDETTRQVGADHAKALLDKLDKMLGKGGE